jgi:hypothetical protein
MSLERQRASPPKWPLDLSERSRCHSVALFQLA